MTSTARRRRRNANPPGWAPRPRLPVGAPMIDPTDPLAQLYADLDDEGTDEDLSYLDQSTSLDALVEAVPEPDRMDDHDVDELALLVKTRIDAGTFSDAESAELGLGEFHDYEGDGSADFDLNPLGLAVCRRLAELEGLILTDPVGVCLTDPPGFWPSCVSECREASRCQYTGSGA